MVDDRGLVREISWRDLCPWLLLTRTFALATSVQMLLAALVAVSLVPVGWRMAGLLLDDAYLNEAGIRGSVLREVRDYNSMWPGERAGYARSSPLDPLLSDTQLPPPPLGAPSGPETISLPPRHTPAFSNMPPPDTPIWGVFARLLAPYRALFISGLPLREWTYFLIGGVWTLLVWAIPGAIITRAAALQLAREEPLDWDRGLWFAGSKFLSYIGAPLVPLIGAFAFAALILAAGWVLRIPVMGPLAVGGLWFLAVIVAFVIGLILLGVALGWPLMWGTLAVEGSDLFDAMSRAYAYTYQRPYHYLFYAAFLSVLGFLAWLLVWQFSEGMIGVLDWAIRWGVSDEQWNALMHPTAEASEQMNFATRFGLGMIVFWTSVIRAVATAFSYSFFWCGAVGLYFLLRRDVDQMEIDEIWSEPTDELLGLPKLRPHASGVPSVEPRPVASPSSAPTAAPEHAPPADSPPRAPGP